MASLENTLLASQIIIGDDNVIASFASAEKATWTFYLDANNMAAGDEIEISVAIQVISSGGVENVINDAINFTDLEPNDKILITIPVLLEAGYTIEVTVNQKSGVAVNYPWRLTDVPISE